YENRFRNRPISGGSDLCCFWVERLPDLHSPSPPGGIAGQFMGALYVSHYLLDDLRVSARRRCTSAAQPLRTVGGGGAGAGACQHSLFPRLHGSERASAGPVRGCTVGCALYRRATGLFRVVPVAPAAERKTINISPRSGGSRPIT